MSCCWVSYRLLGFQNPPKVDIMALLGDKPEDHAHLLFCDTYPHDLQGCKALKNPRLAIPDTPLDVPSATILCLLDAFAGQEWDGRSASVPHEKGSSKEFDCRAPMQSRSYLLALLQRDPLMALGAPSCHSGRTQAFCRWLPALPTRPSRQSSATDSSCRKKVTERRSPH